MNVFATVGLALFFRLQKHYAILLVPEKNKTVFSQQVHTPENVVELTRGNRYLQKGDRTCAGNKKSG
jgi:hypothetical protein